MRAKYFIPFFVFYLFSLNIYSQISFIKFDTIICGNSINNTYTYQNFTTAGGPSSAMHGYNIYKNGQIVYTNNGGSQGYSTYCKDLKFINDSVGYLINYITAGTKSVLRTVDYGVTWTDMGIAVAQNYISMYIVNKNYVYVVSSANTSQTFVYKCSSNTNYQKILIYDTQSNNDIYLNDTIIGNSLCNKDSLLIFLKNNNTPFTYHINFHFLPVGIKENQISNSSIKFYPNPVNDCFSISVANEKIISVSVYNGIGELVKRNGKEEILENKFKIAELKDGLYYSKIETDKNIFYKNFEVIKID